MSDTLQRALRLFLLIIILVLSPASIVPAQQGAPGETRPSSSESSIGGRVVNEAGQPVVNAAIYAQALGASAPPRTTSSDGEGKFQVMGLESGAYIVGAYMPGYIDESSTTLFSPRRYYRPGDIVTLTLIKGGVITGTITNPAGEPIVAADVRAIRVRDAQGHRIKPDGSFVRDRMTDDRGVYRLYGLSPGSYLVFVGGRGQGPPEITPYDNNAPVYAPSSARETAQEINVRAGEEVTGADIRYRVEPGHVVSGRVVSSARTDSRTYGIFIILSRAASGEVFATTAVYGATGEGSFAFYGVPDGVYHLQARQGFANDVAMASTPLRITVRGANVGGADLSLSPLGSISGRLVVDTPVGVDCKEKRANLLRETVIITRRQADGTAKEQSSSALPTLYLSAPDNQGDFTLRGLDAGQYNFELQLPGDNWYLRALTLQASQSKSTVTSKPRLTAKTTALDDLAQHGLALKSGERVTGLTMTIAEGAASLSGRIVAGAEGQRVPAGLRVYLVPAEREAADDVLRYAEAASDTGGAFTLTNLAPGRYLLFARPSPEMDLARPSTPLAWDASMRAELRAEAAAANNAIDLKACQRLSDFALHYK